MELLAPVGNWSMLTAAVKAGADAIYFGVKGFNMRASTQNFEINEIEKVVQFCHENKVKAYCSINIIIFEDELTKLDEILLKLKEAKIDAIICWDLAVVKKAKEYGLMIHLSTQASVSNSEAALLWKELGVRRIILARECSLEDVKAIKEKTNLEIETFIHGARCISVSGRCFMSYDLFGKSANRGECLQSCRREYTVIDDEGKPMKLDNNFIMSAKDLCALPLLDKLTFIDSFKIEGRNRGADYVFKVVSAYREAINAIKEDKFTAELVERLTHQLKEVYNKGFTTSYYIDYPHHQHSDTYGSIATTEKVQLGKVSKSYGKINVAEFKVETEGIKLGDKLAFIGPTTGYEEIIVDEIHTDNGKVDEAKKGEVISVKVKNKVRENDKVYLVKERVNPGDSSNNG